MLRGVGHAQGHFMWHSCPSCLNCLKIVMSICWAFRVLQLVSVHTGLRVGYKTEEILFLIFPCGVLRPFPHQLKINSQWLFPDSGTGTWCQSPSTYGATFKYWRKGCVSTWESWLEKEFGKWCTGEKNKRGSDLSSERKGHRGLWEQTLHASDVRCQWHQQPSWLHCFIKWEYEV